jgi:hypothetical protein
LFYNPQANNASYAEEEEDHTEDEKYKTDYFMALFHGSPFGVISIFGVNMPDLLIIVKR